MSKDIPRHTQEIAKPYIDNFRTAIDIGCRAGEYARYLVGDFKSVKCFEPRKQNRTRFMGSIPKKHFKKVKYYPCALGDVEGLVTMYGPTVRDEDEWWQKKKKRGNIVKGKLLEVKQKTLDSFNFKDVDFIKMDVEGHELKVLKGAVETISIHKPVIVLEQHKHIEKWEKGKRFDAIDFLKTLGYEQVAFDGFMDYVMKYTG